MKKVLLLIFIILISYQSIVAQGNVEQIAKEIITAYKTSDADLLKKHASGILLPAINENFYADKQAKKLVALANEWNGKIIEIRYGTEKMMGKTINLVMVYFKNCKDTDQLCVVLLSSIDKSEWKAVGFGISKIEKAELEEYSLELQSEENIPAKIDHSEFTIEMATGKIVKDPSTEKLQELLKTLDDDNFFITLSCNDGFLQAAYSDDGFSAEYSGPDGYFGATELLSQKEMTKLFIAYIDKVKDWKEDVIWESIE